jgi:hypothetical protein
MGVNLRLLRVHLPQGSNDRPLPLVFPGRWGVLGILALRPARRRVVRGASWPFGRTTTPAALRPDLTAFPQKKAHVKDRHAFDLVRSRESIAPSSASIRFGRLSSSQEFAMAS